MFSGLDPANMPSISVFENKYEYNRMLIETNISFNSSCEHHFLPIVGVAHVAYMSSGKVIGLSKINRLVQYYARRPQVQERMSVQIFNALKEVLDTENVIVVIDAEHLCVTSRGVMDKSSRTTTIEYGGKFNDEQVRSDFFRMVEARQKNL
jgi:GTP cyclohydrolase I